MDDKKIAIIIHAADKKYLAELQNSLEGVLVPEDFALDVQVVTGENKHSAYESARRASDAKYKIYLDEHAVIANKNFLPELLEIFTADKKIGAVGVSGAIELSTHGIAFTSAKRGGKIFTGEQNPKLNDWHQSGEAQILDSFFLATQYDLPWRTDFSDECFGVQAQCVEFRRAGYKIFIARQKVLWLWYRKASPRFDEASRQKFLDEYSADLFPLVTIIIPTFNRPKYFREALDSALAQTYRNIEIFISDNSTDDATEILMHGYRDPRIKYVRHKNFDVHDNWNFARSYNNPDAEYVNWLMDDDLFFPTKIEKMVEVYRLDPDVSLVTSVRNFIDADGKVFAEAEEPFERDIKISGEEAGRLIFLQGNYIGEPTTVLIRKKFLRDNDLCWHADERGFFSLIDVSTWCQLLSRGSLVRLRECLSSYRWHNRQATLWNSTQALFKVHSAKLLKAAWNEKIFLRDEHDFRLAAMKIVSASAEVLKEFYEKNIRTEEVKLMEKTLVALSRALTTDDCTLELPPGIVEEGKP